MLHYINDQTIPRSDYEIIWIEYFTKRAREIDDFLEKNREVGADPFIDSWIIMGLPPGTYYHKHLMYNVGITVSKGKIVVVCDSDTMVKPTFLQSIIETIEGSKDIVLHLDEVRNVEKKFYPFNFPSFDNFLNTRCLNWVGDTTFGLIDTEDSLHSRNYGACLAALRSDLIRIGGADEHIDFLGHICGPYDFTFRMRNCGKREIWHEGEFLYHTWHPGTDGVGNYFGPHDGKNMSTTSLEAIRMGRIQPLVKNPAIKILENKDHEIIYSDPKESLLPTREIPEWDIERMDESIKRRHFEKNYRFTSPLYYRKYSKDYFYKNFKIYSLIITNIIRQSYRKVVQKLFQQMGRERFPNRIIRRGFWGTVFIGPIFILRNWKNHKYFVQACAQTLNRLIEEDILEIALIGDGSTVEMLKALVIGTPINLVSAVPSSRREELKGFNGKIVVASFTRIGEAVSQLEIMGAKLENIIRL